MKPAPFAYHAPESITEAIALLAAHGGQARVLAGGQSLLPLLALRQVRPAALVDINRVPDLAYIRVDDDRLRFGATTRHRDVERTGQREVPETVKAAVAMIGHVAVRNRGTVGGSLAFANPSAEWAAIALAYDGGVVATSVRGERTIPADQFFVAPGQSALEPDELVRELVLSRPPIGSSSAFVEHGRRYHDVALGGAAVVLTGNGSGATATARIAVVGAGRVPTRCRRAEAALLGRSPDADAIAEAVAGVVGEVNPQGADADERSYRLQLAGVLVARALAQAAEPLLAGRRHA